MPSPNSQGGTRVLVFSAWGYAIRKRLGTAALKYQPRRKLSTMHYALCTMHYVGQWLTNDRWSADYNKHSYAVLCGPLKIFKNQWCRP